MVLRYGSGVAVEIKNRDKMPGKMLPIEEDEEEGATVVAMPHFGVPSGQSIFPQIGRGTHECQSGGLG